MNKEEVKTVKLPHPTPVVIVVAGDNPPNPSTYIYFGQLNDHPPIIGIGIKEKRFTYKLIRKYNDWTVNIVDLKILKEADRAGMVSGNKGDKNSLLNLDYTPSSKVKSYGVENAAIIYEIKYMGEMKFPDHNLVYGEVVNIRVDKKYLKGDKIDFESIPFIVSSYNSMDYYKIGEKIKHWGFSLKEE